MLGTPVRKEVLTILYELVMKEHLPLVGDLFGYSGEGRGLAGAREARNSAGLPVT